jgi:hypothetical protein
VCYLSIKFFDHACFFYGPILILQDGRVTEWALCRIFASFKYAFLTTKGIELCGRVQVDSIKSLAGMITTAAVDHCCGTEASLLVT